MKLNDCNSIFFAAKYDQSDILQLLLTQNSEYGINKFCGVDEEFKDSFTPLMVCCAYNSPKTLKLLLNLLNIRVNDKTERHGETGLIIASKHGNTECVDALLTHKHILLDECTSTNGRSPLFFASYQGHCEIVEKLLNEFIRLQQTNNPKPTPSKTVVVDKKCKGGFTALFVAAQNAHLSTVKLLLKHNV